MRAYQLQPSSLSGRVCAPASKSHALRAILFASLASGRSVLRACPQSPDVDAMIQACRALGAEIGSIREGLAIMGVAGQPRWPEQTIDVGNSGIVLRFITALSAGFDQPVHVTGDASIQQQRPMRPLLDALSQLGARYECDKKPGYAPFSIQGPLAAGEAELDGQDSQPVSALLIAALFLSGQTSLSVNHPGEKPWVDLTLSWFDRLGLAYQREEHDRYQVIGPQKIAAFDYRIPGDFSGIAYPLVAALITQSTIEIQGIDLHDAQGDKKMIDVLIAMGANIECVNDSLFVKPSGKLVGRTINVNDMIDAVPILAVLGCYAEGKTQLVEASIARQKESNRLAVMVKELQKMQGNIQETADGLLIEGCALQGATLESHDDHRIAMSLSVAALAAESSSVIQNTACVAKSYQHFFRDLKNLGANLEEKIEDAFL